MNSLVWLLYRSSFPVQLRPRLGYRLPKLCIPVGDVSVDCSIERCGEQERAGRDVVSLQGLLFDAILLQGYSLSLHILSRGRPARQRHTSNILRRRSRSPCIDVSKNVSAC
eukprot:763980-Hanusia_phi.AAC.2